MKTDKDDSAEGRFLKVYDAAAEGYRKYKNSAGGQQCRAEDDFKYWIFLEADRQRAAMNVDSAHVVVPKEPTSAMLEEAAFNLSADYGPEFVAEHERYSIDCYRYLVAAAPKFTYSTEEAVQKAVRETVERISYFVDQYESEDATDIAEFILSEFLSAQPVRDGEEG